MKNLIIIFLLISFVSSNWLLGQSESQIIHQLFSSSNEITKLSTDMISLAVDAVWGASEVTGVPTITGTLTQSPSNLDDWSYSSSPTDKLVIMFANGAAIDFKFTNIEGYEDGDAEDFKNSHYMNFTTYSANEIDLHIISSTGPEDGVIKWQRNIQGDVLYENEMMNVNINHNGQYQGEISGGIGIFRYWDEALGVLNSSSASFTVSEAYWRTMSHNSNQRIFALDTQIKNNSSVTIDNITYKFQNVDVFWVAYTQFADSAYIGIYNEVINAHQWAAEGSLLKNNQLYGTVQFDSEPVDYTFGPTLICKLGNGSEVYLHSLLSPYVTDVEQNENSPYQFILKQNYPNPFNPSTTIKYGLPSESNVKISIYNLLGEEIQILFDGIQKAGFHNLEFDASNLSSGIYLYRISASSLETRKEFQSVKKMILLK